jgi:putative transposase
VRLYFRFPLSYRSVEELMFERGVVVSYETIRRWCLKFGSAIAADFRRRRPQPKGTWQLDEMRITTNGKAYWLWRRDHLPCTRSPVGRAVASIWGSTMVWRRSTMV